jgi:hypothetical protein
MKKIVRSRMARLLAASVVLASGLMLPVDKPKAQFNGGNSDCNISFIDRSQRRVADFFAANFGTAGSNAFPAPNDSTVINVGFNLTFLPQSSFPIGPPGNSGFTSLFNALFGSNDGGAGAIDGCIDNDAGTPNSANAWIRWRTRCGNGITDGTGTLTVRELGFTAIAPNNNPTFCNPSRRWIIIYDAGLCSTIGNCSGSLTRTSGHPPQVSRVVTGNPTFNRRHFIEVGLDNSSCSGIGTYEIVQCCTGVGPCNP